MRYSLLLASLLFAACSSPAPDDHDHEPAAPKGAATSAELLRALCLPAAHADDDAGRAQQRLQTLVEQNGTTADGLVALGQAWARKARQGQEPVHVLAADACAQLALDRAPAHPGAKTLRVMTMLTDHRFAAARDAARALLAEHPDEQMVHGLLADALFELGDLEGAIAATQRMVDLKPNLPSYARASHLAWMQGDVAAARVIARQAVSAGQEQKQTEPLSFVLTQTADMFWYEGDIAGADAGYDLALEKTPNYAKALLGKARVAFAQGRYGDAAALATRSFAAVPLAETAWLLGDAEAARGNAQEAADAYAQLARIGRHHDARTLAQYLALTGQEPERAVTLAEREMRSRPGPLTKSIYALALARAGRGPEALRQVDDLQGVAAPDPRLWVHAGLVRLSAGETAAGQALLDKARAQNAPLVARMVR